MRNDLSASPPSTVSRRALVAAAIVGSAALVAPATAHADGQRDSTVARAARPHAPECLADLLPDGA